MLAQIRQLTDDNHHNEARLAIAEHVLQDEELTALYRDILGEHHRIGYMPPELLARRDMVDDTMLRPRLEAAGLGAYYGAL